MEYSYDSIQIKQTNSQKLLTLFAAPATEIDQWAGIPQKKRFGTGEETAGFQREINKRRISDLKQFYLDKDNIVQNPLLCSTREIPNTSIEFIPNNDHELENTTCYGKLLISIPDFSSFSLKEIFRFVREYIENRVVELKEREPDENLVNQLKSQAVDSGQLYDDENENENENNEEIEIDDDPPTKNGENEYFQSALFEESHIIDFWNEIAARHEILKLIDEPTNNNEFLGFNKDAMLSYLYPIVLVDGQHRLHGAIQAAKELLNSNEIKEEIELRISNGDEPKEVENEILCREVRTLPVSLLMTNDPAEQVFQFVVVNQKATPIGKALLGTIVSTTLANEEMESVAERLKNAGIQLEQSQAISYLSRHPDSPFYKLIERGLAGDAKDLLQWSVFSNIISIFRELKGGKLFGSKNDYASIWRDKFLNESTIVEDFEKYDYNSQYQYWYQLDGPWRSIFIKFWTTIRDKFGNRTDPDKPNYWGKPRSSNLFNKISLTILAADFFQFLVETRSCIKSVEDIADLVETWLEDVNLGALIIVWPN